MREADRLQDVREGRAPWRRWGPYLAERAWGTVREDYSADGDAWSYFPHEQARSRAYRWSEDGLLGFCDDHQRLCFAPALWNGRDPILKERLFGLSGHEGNHGEDVKEVYQYLDATPTHSYMKALYRYPQREFPYEELVAANAARGKHDPEFELVDTAIFAEDRYFDVVIEYAKAGPEDVLIRLTATNRGPELAELHLLPTVWFRNTWSWGRHRDRPVLHGVGGHIRLDDPDLGSRWLVADVAEPDWLFTENETNAERLFGGKNASRYVKDGIHQAVIHGDADAINPAQTGTKAALHHRMLLGTGDTAVLRLRLSEQLPETGGTPVDPFGDFDAVMAERRREADAFHAEVLPAALDQEERGIARQALAGMLWNKQYYHYAVKAWLDGDPAGPPPPAEREDGRNAAWCHFHAAEILSMPDKWEYPWFAAWDLAFHCVTLALVDPDFAKDQLILLLREWYMHPNGQLPAYEWNFEDTNPPVHAWAALQVYRIERERWGRADRDFLERVFHKLLLNFTWWVNRQDRSGNNVFEGGFLGLDNIGVFDRNAALPTGGYLEQSDGTSWMAMFALDMLAIALELAQDDPTYEDLATKFLEHFLYIAHAMNEVGTDELALWDEDDGFYYDALHLPGGRHYKLKVRSLVGLIPILAVEVLDPALVARLPGFKARMEWFLTNRPDLVGDCASLEPGEGGRQLLALVGGARLRRILATMLDEAEFLSPHGIRSLSRFHREHPYVLDVNGQEYRVDYDPAESTTGMFGGNSNWRGPVWFPVNYLLISALREHHAFLGADYRVEYPAGSGRELSLAEIADELASRLCSIFMPAADGHRPVHARDWPWPDLVTFAEYFDGDTGEGLGATHQTGWTGLIANLLLRQRNRLAGQATVGAIRASESPPLYVREPG